MEDLNELEIRQEPDEWTYIWGTNLYQASRAYKQMKGFRQTHKGYKWLWDSCCQTNHKVFFWLVLKDKLSTRDILQHKNMQLQLTDCVLCAEHQYENILHLFIQCRFAKACWRSLRLNTGQQQSPIAILRYLKGKLMHLISWKSSF